MNKKELILKSDFVISFGTMLSNNKEETINSIIESIAKTNVSFVYMHPIDNIDLKPYYTQFIKYEVGSEEGICALLLDTFVKDAPSSIMNFIKDLDLGYISAESSAGEEEFEDLALKASECTFKSIIIGDDLIEHPRVENIVKCLAIIKKYTDFNLIVLNDSFEEKINSCVNFDLEEVEELKSYDGTIVYRLIANEANEDLITSTSFSRIAKVSNNDEVYVSYKNEKVKKCIKIDEKLQGTIAIAKIEKSDYEVFNDYRYKQVKIEKVDS